VKTKFYTSLLLGFGLAVLTTSSYAKSVHTAHKKNTQNLAKSGKKHGVTPIKHTVSKPQKFRGGLISVKHTVPHKHRLHDVISRIKNAHKRHDVHHGQKLQFGHKKLPKAGRSPLEKFLPPLTVTIPHLPSHNEFIKPEVEATETNTRIHTFISSERQDRTIDRPIADDGSHDYTTTHGIITSSLADAGLEAGLSEELVNQLTHIFAWDIDFATNLHVGDEFTVIYESNGIGEERIIAAEFVTEGRVLTAVRYEDSEGNVNYYTPEGKAMRKAFLSTPVDYARITSHFDAHRRHPILNRIRAHKGVDYAARIGTPVKTTGDGKIAYMGRKGGYGQVIIIQHGERFETLYAHLSGFNNHLLEGDNVSQGDVIGYVGQTGLATGPHLHYEFRVDGIHRNPEITGSDSRNAMALNSVSLQDFKMQTRAIIAQLYSAKAQSLFAKNQEQPR